MVERFREQLSNERVADRIARMLAQLERAAGGGSASEREDELAQVQAGLQFGQQTDLGKTARKPPRRRHGL
jgi:ATP-dependent helicase Lhr and Lhr-like helicase